MLARPLVALMSERCPGRVVYFCQQHDHPRVVAPTVHLHVGAARQCHLHLYQHFPFADLRYRHLFDAYILFAGRGPQPGEEQK